MRVAAGQVSGGTDKAANLATIRSMTTEAAGLGVELVVFPEQVMFKQAVRDRDFLDAAEDLDGPFASAVRTLAREQHIALVVGMVERIPDAEQTYNTLLVVGPDGEDLGVYRKIHLYDAFGGLESDMTRPGRLDQSLVVEIGDLQFGLMTCYDIRFPEMARVLVDQGAEAILLPTAWTPGPRKEDHWATLVRARAIENTAFVVGADIAPPICPGGSLIVDPMGVILAELGEQVGLAVADLSRERLEAVRKHNPSLEHRRFNVVPRLAAELGDQPRS